MASNIIQWTDKNIADYLESCYDRQSLMQWVKLHGLHNHPLVLNRLDYLKAHVSLKSFFKNFIKTHVSLKFFFKITLFLKNNQHKIIFIIFCFYF